MEKLRWYSPRNLYRYPIFRIRMSCNSTRTDKSISESDQVDDDLRPLVLKIRADEVYVPYHAEGTFDYFNSFWNGLDITSLTLIFLAYLFRFMVFFRWTSYDY